MITRDNTRSPNAKTASDLELSVDRLRLASSVRNGFTSTGDALHTPSLDVPGTRNEY